MSAHEWKCCGCGSPPPFLCKCVTGVAYKIGGGSDWKDNIRAALEPVAQPEPWPGACHKCGGAGWLWGHELDNYEHPHPGQADDTRYSCDGPLCLAVRGPETPTPGQFTTMCLAIEDVVTGRGLDVAIPEEVKAYMRNVLMVGGWRGERE